MKRVISTIGYEGVTIEDFIAHLKQTSINLLIDVRDIPLSRKKGFSKNKFAEILRSWDIDYIHLRGLGDPKKGREAARAGKYSLFAKIFERHLQTSSAQRDMEVAANLVRTYNACLMCFESNHETCHRNMVARVLSEITGLTVDNLSIQNNLEGRIAA
jgi:uncharacterized protein (DUF488 family)